MSQPVQKRDEAGLRPDFAKTWSLLTPATALASIFTASILLLLQLQSCDEREHRLPAAAMAGAGADHEPVLGSIHYHIRHLVSRCALPFAVATSLTPRPQARIPCVQSLSQACC